MSTAADDVARTDVAHVEHEEMDFSPLRTFGHLHLEVPEVKMDTSPLAILVNLDRSGSMNDVCMDGHTKLEHIRRVLKNICALLAKYVKDNSDMRIRLCMLSFSHDIATVFQTGGTVGMRAAAPVVEDGWIDIAPCHLPFIYETLDQMDVWGLTNIEKSLKSVQEKMATFRQNHPDYRMIHILMTDGEATVGKTLPSELLEYVNTDDHHVFLGVGDDHDSFTLNYMADHCDLGEYRFMDQLEKSGWICGEILYNLLYPYSTVCELSSETATRTTPKLWLKSSPGVKIYDWHTNTWDSELCVPSLSGNMKKDYQVYVEFPYLAEDAVLALETEDGELLATFSQLPFLVDIDTDEVHSPTLTNYLWRQRVQECMYKVKTYQLMYREQTKGIRNQKHGELSSDVWQATRSKIAQEMKSLRQELQLLYDDLRHEYAEAEMASDTDAEFLRVLMEDVFVVLRTLGTKNGFMYTSSRMSSQGNQHFYTPTGTFCADGSPDSMDRENHGRRNQTFFPDDDAENLSTQTINWNHLTMRSPRINTTPYIHDSAFSMMTQLQETSFDAEVEENTDVGVDVEADAVPLASEVYTQSDSPLVNRKRKNSD